MSQPKQSYAWVWILVVAGAAFLLIPCVGIMAAVAIPAFIGYTTRAKTAEAGTQLRALYEGAASYYAETGCVVDSAITSNTPGPGKTVVGAYPESFEALGFMPADPIYYQYEIVSIGGCGHEPDEAVYSFRAHGDLDGDGVQSLFEISAGAAQDIGTGPRLYRTPAIYRENELE